MPSPPRYRLSPNVLYFLLLFLLALLCFLPLAQSFGFYRDDWYLVYAGTSQGAASFNEIFSIDRPLRGPFLAFFFNMFGSNAPLYSYTAFTARLFGAMGLYWIMKMVWPRATEAAWAAALLSVVYPGFLDMPNALDFQAHVWSFAIAIWSIALSVKSISVGNRLTRAGMLLISIVLQFVYLLLMEYFIGIEGLRIALTCYVSTQLTDLNISSKRYLNRKTTRLILKGLARSTPLLLAGSMFVLWRVYYFQDLRAATDITILFDRVSSAPLLELVWEPVRLVRDLLNVLIYAWGVPDYTLAVQLRLRDSLLVFGMGFLVGLITWFGSRLLFRRESEDRIAESQESRGMVIVGLIGALAALIPIHFGCCQVLFDQFGRFSLTSSVGAVILLVGVWSLFPRGHFKVTVLALMMAIAGVTHTANSIRHIAYTNMVNDFWWQVTWRAPQIKPGTVLVANYGGQRVAEDYFVWGPSNLIYYPTLPPEAETVLQLTATTLERIDILSILEQRQDITIRRGIVSQKDYTKVLVLSMPTPNSCVHVLDGQSPELSENDPSSIFLLAQYSKLEQIDEFAKPHRPPQSIFGDEPARNWCYYYERAALARQQGAWNEIVSLAEEASRADLRPIDQVEWIPFIYAYAQLNMEEEFQYLANILRDNSFLRA